jgi:hypothetical protein
VEIFSSDVFSVELSSVHIAAQRYFSCSMIMEDFRSIFSFILGAILCWMLAGEKKRTQSHVFEISEGDEISSWIIWIAAL